MTSIESFGHSVSHAWESCTETVVTSCTHIRDGFEAGREKIVKLARDRLSENQAYVVERIVGAVPEIFVAISSLWAGLLTIPALLVSWGRKIEPMIPLVHTILKGDMSPLALGTGIRQSLDNFDRMFERVIVPSLFVAFTVDTIFSFTVGWLAQDWGKMLHGSTIAMPGAFLALRYMLHQHTLEMADLPSVQTIE